MADTWRHLRFLHLWHRCLGATALVLLLVLTTTGVLLNHGSALHLDRRPVTNWWLLNWYGMDAAAPGPTFRVHGHYLSQWNRELFLDETRLGDSQASLVAGENLAMSIDGEMLDWRREEHAAALHWAAPVSLPETLVHAIAATTSPLDLERVLLDLHSGRFFGPHGVHVMDAAAVILLSLGLSGGYLWLRRHHRRGGKKQGGQSAG